MPSEQTKKQAVDDVIEILTVLEEYKIHINERLDKVFVEHGIGDPVLQKVIKHVARIAIPQKGFDKAKREADETSQLCAALDPQLKLFS